MNCVMCTVVRALLLDVDVGFWLLCSQLDWNWNALKNHIIRIFTKMEDFIKQKQQLLRNNGRPWFNFQMPSGSAARAEPGHQAHIVIMKVWDKGFHGIRIDAQPWFAVQTAAALDTIRTLAWMIWGNNTSIQAALTNFKGRSSCHVIVVPNLTHNVNILINGGITSYRWW